MQSFRGAWKPKEIRIEACDAEMTASAGLGTMMSLFDQSEMSKRFADCLPSRVSSRSLGNYRLGLIQLASMIHGADSIDDLEDLRDDPSWEEYIQGDSVAPRTMGDFLRDFKEEEIEKLEDYLVWQSKWIRKSISKAVPVEYKPSSKPHFSIDSTSHVQCGQKMEGLAWNYKHEWGLGSQVVFDELGLSNGFWLHEGNVKSGVGSRRQLEKVFSSKSKDWSSHLSADAAYCYQDLFRFCTEYKVHFTFTANEATTGWRNHVDQIVNWKTWEFSEEEKKKYTRRGKGLPEVEVGSFMWSPGWAEGKLRFPIVVKRTKAKGENPTLFDQTESSDVWKHYAVVTNKSLAMKDLQSIIELHNKRGNAERFIKEEKYGFDLKHFPCQKLRANWAYGLLAQVAHNILRWVATIQRPHKPHFSKKLRKRFIFGAGRIVRHARQVTLKVTHKFKKEVDRLRELLQVANNLPAPNA